MDVSNSEYHSSAGYSSSDMKQFAKSPRGFRDLQATKGIDSDKPHFLFGTIAHERILEGIIEPPANVVIKPENMSFATTEGKQWKAQHEGKQIITFADWEKTRAMPAAINADQYARRLVLSKGQNEVTVVARCPITGITMRARPDRLLFDKGTNTANRIIDLKTAVNASKGAFSAAAGKFGYIQQAAWYMETCALLCVDVDVFDWVVIEKEFPHDVACYWIGADNPAIQAATDYNQMQRQKLSKCLEEDYWPGICEHGPEPLEVHPWAVEDMVLQVQEWEEGK